MAYHLPQAEGVSLTLVMSEAEKYEQWSFFKEQWNGYVVATGLAQKENVREATLCTVMGKKCFLEQELKRRELPESEMQDPDEILEALEKFFKPRQNIVYESFLFNSRTQNDGESALAFYQALQQLAAT